ncbi:hypothetical protein Kpho02_15770 [Kitasatospora phosalacinea]|uniref:Uncharacterized protein n=1 Tax=Kitasatospora phosalacinea TaxID=2065 RepID=A0A9W6Q6G0_9ACTN|nr:hypothetical protein [Kitasatospora phosalacinea]GLW69278.1 hypothetical protein Kpho02_15770 [Kitasatospora phosalacinea]
MYEYEMFKVRERELHGRAAAERLAREAAGARTGLVERVVRAVRREGAPRVKSVAEKGRSAAAAGCAG